MLNKIGNITVFTSSYNYSRHLRRAIESVLGQTYKDFEYHLVDYGSTDATWEIMQTYARDLRVRCMQIGKQPNKVYAMNHSIRNAKDGYWIWCPADDYFQKTLVEKCVEYAKRYPGEVFYVDRYVVDDRNVVRGSTVRKEFTPEELKEKIWKGSVIGFGGICIPTDILRSLPFPEDEDYSEDYRWMIKAVMLGVPFRRIPEKLIFKRMHTNSESGRRLDEIVANIKAIHEKVRKELEEGI